MTTRVTLAVACTMGLVLGFPSSARAGVGWLEKLSGPGPFFGIVYPLTITCDRIMQQEVERGAESSVYIEQIDRRRFFTCPLPTERGVTLNRLVGVELWRLWTDQNELPYDGNVDTGVRVTAGLGTLELAISRSFKIGGAAGVAWFSGDAFDTFARVVVQPARLTVAPLALFFPGNKKLEFLKVHANGNIFVGGVSARDFGATGDFKAPFEVQWQTSIEIDVFAFKHATP
jgi:hypothetical protein